MNRTSSLFCKVILATVSSLTLLPSIQAQSFKFVNNDLALGFRKAGTLQENNEVVVNLGQASVYLNMLAGSSLTLTNFTLTQLTPGSFLNLNNLSWSVVGYYQGIAYPGYSNNTLWVTVPRLDANTPGAPATRTDSSGFPLDQQSVRSQIASIFANAAYISKALNTTNEGNNVTFVRESIATYGPHILSVNMAGILDNTQGTLQDTWPENNLENVTPADFSSVNTPVRSDLYEVRPFTDNNGNPVADPHTGTNGLAYYVGYFQFNNNGTMTFTRASAATPPPPAPVISITRSNNTSTIAFNTTSGATYTLYYTNTAGLNQPLNLWPSSPATLNGNGQPGSLTDTTTDASRVYRVGAQ